MFKLIKMDFYRLFSSKAIKVGAIMACVVSAAYMMFALGMIELTKFALQTDPEAAAEFVSLIPIVGWMYGVDFAEIIISGTSALAIFVGCMITCSFIGTEQSCGYTKNFAGQLNDKGYMAVSKFVVTSVAQVMVIVIYTIVCSLFAQFVFGQYITGYAIGTLATALCLRILLHLAINAVIIFICTLTKSHAVAMVVGCIFGIGVTHLVYLMASSVLSALKINFNIGDYMPDGVNGQISLTSSSDVYVKGVCVSLVFIAVFVIANYFVLKKRDVK